MLTEEVTIVSRFQKIFEAVILFPVIIMLDHVVIDANGLITWEIVGSYVIDVNGLV
jgi:hypothetical protein